MWGLVEQIKELRKIAEYLVMIVDDLELSKRGATDLEKSCRLAAEKALGRK